jgi:PhoH-like ATPase
MSEKKIYVLDTNILIEDPKAFFRFQENDIILPIYVLEELDKFKGEQSNRGANSREAIRTIDNLRTKGDLNKGVKLEESNGTFYVYHIKDKKQISNEYEHILTDKSMDNSILLCCLELQRNNYSTRTILVTMDVSLRCRANAIGIQVSPYRHHSVDTNTLKNKVIEISLSDSDIDLFYKQSFIDSKELAEEYDLEFNSCLNLKGETKSALARFYKRPGQINPSINQLKIPNKNKTFGLSARNREQQFALDMLLDDEIKFITIMGNAGSGKSILTLAASLHQVVGEGKYNKLLVSRPVIPMGRDIGYLPGSAEEKLRPYMQPIYDNLDYLMMTGGAEAKKRGRVEDLFNEKIIEIEPLVYIRGRSIPNQIMLVDEAQGLNNHEFKTILTRCGENTKIIFTGDINQIDNPYVSASTNGLSVAVKKMRDNPMVGHILLEKGERSALANLAIECL